MISFLFLRSLQIPVKCVGMNDKLYFSQYKDGHRCYSLDERYAQRVDDSRGFECIYPHTVGNYNKTTDDTPCIQCLPDYIRLSNNECEYKQKRIQKLNGLGDLKEKDITLKQTSCTVGSSSTGCQGGEVCIGSSSSTGSGTCFSCDTFSTQGTVVNNNCKCKTGFAATQTAQPVQVCYECPRGTYTDDTGGRPICKKCPSGTTTNEPGSFSDAFCFKEVDQWAVIGITIAVFIVIIVSTIVILYIYVRKANKKRKPTKKRATKLESQQKPDLLNIHTGSAGPAQESAGPGGIIPSAEAAEDRPEASKKKK